METPVPPPLPSHSAQKIPTLKVCLRIIGIVILIIAMLFVGSIMIGIFFGSAMTTMLFNTGRLTIESSSNIFQVKVIELTAEQNYFMERVNVRCSEDMEIGIQVMDLQKAGIFQASGPNGETLYREGEPCKIGGSVPVHAKHGLATCNILVKINTSPTDTLWHSEFAGAKIDTSLPGPLTVSNIQTNWRGPYDRRMDLPLADLGKYKIMLTLK